jgi:hypothetical protein
LEASRFAGPSSVGPYDGRSPFGWSEEPIAKQSGKVRVAFVDVDPKRSERFRRVANREQAGSEIGKPCARNGIGGKLQDRRHFVPRHVESVDGKVARRVAVCPEIPSGAERWIQINQIDDIVFLFENSTEIAPDEDFDRRVNTNAGHAAMMQAQD